MKTEKERHLDKRQVAATFAPLSRYDDAAAREVEELGKTSSELSKEMDAMTEELERLNEFLDTTDLKERIRALHAEKALHDENITELRKEVPLLSEQCAALRLALEPAGLEAQLNSLTSQLQELRRQKERFDRELPVLAADSADSQRRIAESEALIREITSSVAEAEAQVRQIESKNESLERLEELQYFISAIFAIDERGDTLAQGDAAAGAGKYYAEIAALELELTKKDMQAYAKARDFFGRLSEEYGHIGKEINDLLLFMRSKFSFMQEVEEKSGLAVSLEAEIGLLQAALREKAAELDKIRALTSEDKKRVAALEDEISRFRETIAPFAAEAAKGGEIIKKKEAAVEEFVSLFVQKDELTEKIVMTGQKLRALKKIAEEAI
jgi:chromosome segregation ATPase